MHTDPSIKYIKENIQCPIDFDDPESLHINDLFEYYLSTNCLCTSTCTLETNCPCILNFGLNYKAKVLYEENINKPHIECGVHCKCPSTCSNRLVQFGPHKSLCIFKTKNKSLGLKSTTKIAKYTFVCEYAGEVITSKMAQERYALNKALNKMNYIFCLNEIIHDKVTKTFVDPSTYGNIGRYINHSCNPNCFIVPVRVNINVPKLCIFTIKDVDVDEELTFDYGYNSVSNGGTVCTPCLCGEDQCRKWLPFDIENA